MADYCAQCTIEHFGADLPNDFAGLGLADDECARVLCEGCGYVFVDALGRCLDVEPHSGPESGAVDWTTGPRGPTRDGR